MHIMEIESILWLLLVIYYTHIHNRNRTKIIYIRYVSVDMHNTNYRTNTKRLIIDYIKKEHLFI